MKTFEEYQFKVKHTQIKSNYSKSLYELVAGDWFYLINAYVYEHCQITKVEDRRNNSIRLWFNRDGQEDKRVLYFNKKIVDDGCTNYDVDWCLTTDSKIAEKWHKKMCPNEELIEYPAK